MQALEIQGNEMQALLIAMHLFICGIQHPLCFKNYCLCLFSTMCRKTFLFFIY